jgi:hypothetical protein
VDPLEAFLGQKIFDFILVSWLKRSQAISKFFVSSQPIGKPGYGGSFGN